MRQVQKFILWGSGVYVLINLVAIFLSWSYFGILEWEVIWEMALIAFPPLLVAMGSYFSLAVGSEYDRQHCCDESAEGRNEVAYGKATH